ncbi:Aste57867_10606 [Aphanomyces stellatus]|uniref:Aste57867_10606 protein n=1 Tax=Aphanomyces stellatus TaxID=120398 RepID=A0A485KRV2_9STRA|nr:hypothetical protein As57867_010566 [Aphanomyces stellatus]VFT87478.1 Aste57867_10606 [Aphanomyces stellatus]
MVFASLFAFGAVALASATSDFHGQLFIGKSRRLCLESSRGYFPTAAPCDATDAQLWSWSRDSQQLTSRGPSHDSSTWLHLHHWDLRGHLFVARNTSVDDEVDWCLAITYPLTQGHTSTLAQCNDQDDTQLFEFASATV